MSVPIYDGDTAFQSILNQIKLDKDVYSVKAFVAGYVWGIEMLQPSHLIEELLLKGTEGEIRLANEKQAKSFYGNLMGLWNEIASHNSSVVCKFRPLPSATDDQKALRSFFDVLNFDVNMFLAALMETGSLDCDDQKIKAIEDKLEKMSETLEEHEPLAKKTKISDLERAQLFTLLSDCHQKWQVLFPAMGKALDSYRKQSASQTRYESSTTSANNPKIGRNEPCPCGSGMKYKKCCMPGVVH